MLRPTKPLLPIVFSFLFFILIPGLSYCQIDQGELPPLKIYNKQIFRSTKFINTPSIKGQPKDGFEFNIVHRFGLMDYDENVFDDFFGLDLSSNIRLGFAVPVTKDFYVGIGRTKFGKTYDIEANYILMRQTMNWKQPVTLSLYHNTSYMSNDFPRVTDNMYTKDTSQFAYKDAHRFSYYTQLSIGSQITNWLSIQASPALIYKNLVSDLALENWIMTLPISGRIKTAMLSSFIFELIPVLINKPYNFKLPVGVGYEIKTVSHVFQITLNNTNQILNQEVFYSNVSHPFKDGIFLGFNLQKFFYIKPQ